MVARDLLRMLPGGGVGFGLGVALMVAAAASPALAVDRSAKDYRFLMGVQPELAFVGTDNAKTGFRLGFPLTGSPVPEVELGVSPGIFHCECGEANVSDFELRGRLGYRIHMYEGTLYVAILGGGIFKDDGNWESVDGLLGMRTQAGDHALIDFGLNVGRLFLTRGTDVTYGLHLGLRFGF